MGEKTSEGLQVTGQQPDAAAKRPNLRDSDPQAYEVFLDELREACGLPPHEGKTLEEVVRLAQFMRNTTVRQRSAPRHDSLLEQMLKAVYHDGPRPEALDKQVEIAVKNIETFRKNGDDAPLLRHTVARLFSEIFEEKAKDMLEFDGREKLDLALTRVAELKAGHVAGYNTLRDQLERVLQMADTSSERGGQLADRVDAVVARLEHWRHTLVTEGFLNPVDGEVFRDTSVVYLQKRLDLFVGVAFPKGVPAHLQADRWDHAELRFRSWAAQLDAMSRLGPAGELREPPPPPRQGPPLASAAYNKLRDDLTNAEMWVGDFLLAILDCEGDDITEVYGSWATAVDKALRVIRQLRLPQQPPPGPVMPPQGQPNPIGMFLDQLIASSDMSGPSAFDILKVCMELAVFLIDKNRKYGDSALDPVRIMSSSDPIEQIKVRMDDKLSRLYRGHLGGEDAMQDLVGYWVLLRVAESKTPPA